MREDLIFEKLPLLYMLLSVSSLTLLLWHRIVSDYLCQHTVNALLLITYLAPFLLLWPAWPELVYTLNPTIKIERRLHIQNERKKISLML